MKTLPLLVSLLWSLCASLPLQAQPQTFEHGELRWKMSPNGDLSNDDFWLEMANNQEWTPIFNFPSLWMAGVNPDGDLAFQETGKGGEPSMAGSDYTLNKIWSVTAHQVEQHLADWADNGQIDNPIPAIFQWPGRGNAFFNDYNNMSLPPEELARSVTGFYDTNGDNLYDPSQGEYPVLPLRGCSESPITPSNMHYCVFSRLEGPNQGVPLPMEVHLYVFTYGCENEHPLNQTVFVYQQLRYTAGEDPTQLSVFNDLYTGLFIDPKIGCEEDDYVGSFPDLQAMFSYNKQDEDCENSPGSSDIFDGNPPAIGVQMLRGPLNDMGQALSLSSTMYYLNPGVANPPVAMTDPQTIVQNYGYLQGTWRDGSALTLGGNGYGGSATADFVFPGFPEQPGGWTEWEAQNDLGDRRMLLNFGPFNLQPGAVNEVLTAYSFYRGPGSHLEQVNGLYDQMALIQSFAGACFIPENTPGFPECDALPVTAPQVEAQQQELRVFPNPFVDWLTVELPEQAARYQVSLLDLQGRILWQAELASGQQRLHLPNLPSGLYLLRAQSGQSAPLLAKVVR